KSMDEKWKKYEIVFDYAYLAFLTLTNTELKILLGQERVDLKKLQELCFTGIPEEELTLKTKCQKLLLRYLLSWTKCCDCRAKGDIVSKPKDFCKKSIKNNTNANEIAILKNSMIEPLCNVNRPLQEKIWKTDMHTCQDNTYNCETFVMQLEQCLKVDLHALLRVMKKGDDVMAQKKKDEFVQFGSNKLTCEEIEHSIDLLKLGLIREEKKDIETIILQFEICKDIYAIRMNYWKKGGTPSQDKLKLAASNHIPNFDSQKIMWVERLKQWNKACIELRHEYPCLDILASKYIVPFLQRLDYQLHDVSQVLHEWKDQNNEDMQSLQELGRIFSQVWMKSKNNESAPNSFSILLSLKAGRPNLVIANHNNKLFSIARQTGNTAYSVGC
ncbi:hypothetical protein RFI_36968, partial [Reticulomyxa filosa]